MSDTTDRDYIRANANRSAVRLSTEPTPVVVPVNGPAPFGYELEEGVQWPGVVDEALVYTDPFGVETDLSTLLDERYKEGLNGRFIAPVQHLSDAVPLQDGARYRETRLDTNQLTVPITIVAPDITTLRARLRELMRALNPKRGVGRLTVHTIDGLSRYCNAIYEGGVEVDPATQGEEYDARIVLIFRCFDPSWYDLRPVVRHWRTGVTAKFFPILPVRLGSSTIFTQFIEENEGDVETWPVWRINGPGSGLEMVNQSTGERMSLAYDIPPSTSIVIDTRPGHKSVTTAEGNNVFAGFRGQLWPLAVGSNRVSVRLLQTTERSALNLEYQTRYLGV